MRKMILVLLLGCVFIGGSLFAADGDLKVDGSVGIGIDPSTYKLDVNGGTYLRSNVGVGTPPSTYNLDVNGTSALRGTVWTSGSNIEVRGLTAGNNYAYIDFRGDDTYSDYGLRLLRGNEGPNTWSELQHRGTGRFYLHALEAAPITIRTAYSDANSIHLTSTGNVGVGTTTPTTKFQVYGTSAPIVSIQAGSSWMGQKPQSTGDHMVYWDSTRALRFGTTMANDGVYAWSEKVRITSGGFVGIGSNNPPYLLTMEASGGGYYNQSTRAWTNGSSGRWKSGIKPITGALDTVLKLDGVSFKWKKRTDTFEDSVDGTKLYVSSSWADDPNGRDDIGLIAEDVMKVLPVVVDADPKDSNFATGVAYSKLVPLLIEAIKEQQREIAKLKEDLEALKR